MANVNHLQMLEAARALDRAGEREPAVAAYRRLLELEPGSVEGWADLGGLLMVMGRLGEAQEACDQALRLDRNCLVARVNATCVLMHQGCLEEAAGMFRQILALDPGRGDASLALAECLVKQRAYGEAREVLGGILQRDPGDLRAHQMLGQIFHRLGLWAEYQKEIDRRLAIAPDCAYTDYERGYLGLLFGDLPEAWQRFESRLKVPGLIGPKRDFPQPRWNGAPFPDRTLLLHYEQGYGDTLMFLRYASLVKALGGQVLVEVQPELAEVAATCPGIDAVIAHGDPLPPFDLQLSLLSLPAVLGTGLAGIPAEIPYLDIPQHVPNQDQIAHLLAAAERCTRIGLAWSGNAAYRNDEARSIPTEALRPLAALPNAFFYGFGLDTAEPAPVPGYLSLAPWLSSFSDTAYALSGMDLVITVDTAVAHLAGALGIPTLLLLAHVPDWRWMLGRDDTPWYRSMQIYRQPAPGDWNGLVSKVMGDLAASS
jgi:tetratricopeptide (TPR) repeat protein